MPTALSVSTSAAELALERDILQGYAARHASAHHRASYVRRELAEWRCFRAFTERPPWQWERADMDRYGAQLTRRYHRETIREKQGAVRRILAYARDPAYEWDDRAYALTRRHIPQICVPENTVVHQHGSATSKRRELTPAELDRLFAAVRARIGRIEERGGDARPARMHFALLCAALAFGLREAEEAALDLEDLTPARTPAIAAFSPFETLVVRNGKAKPGGGARRRVIYAMRLFRQYLGGLQWYLTEVRPQLRRAHSPAALFLSQRGARLRPDRISTIFREYRTAARLTRDLTQHCLRHTFETVLRQSGLDVATLMLLMGHDHESSTLIYDHVGPVYLQRQALAHNRRLLAEDEQRARAA